MDGEIYSEKVCPMCGTRFTVLWPQQWAYKRGKPNPKFFCSWKCFRSTEEPKFERREKTMKRAKITLEDKKKAVQIALDGGDPVKFLQGKGAADAVQVWGRIKRDLKETDPETFGKLPKRAEKKEPEKADKDEPQDFDQAAQDLIDNAKNSSEDIKNIVEACRNIAKAADAVEVFHDSDEFEVSAIRHKNFGEFYYDHDHNCIDWRTPEGDEVSMCVPGWKELIDKLPVILSILGVK